MMTIGKMLKKFFEITAPKSKILRTVIEKSMMHNNDEYSLYADSEEKMQKLIKVVVDKFSNDYFSDPRVILTRPIYDIELEEGLNVQKSINDCFDEKVPDITILLDELHKAVDMMADYNMLKIDFSSFISMVIGTQYYDCMSGGVSYPWIWVIRKICQIALESGLINLDKTVYPRGEGEPWYTLRDFLYETKNVDLKHIDNLKLLESNLR